MAIRLAALRLKLHLDPFSWSSWPISLFDRADIDMLHDLPPRPQKYERIEGDQET